MKSITTLTLGLALLVPAVAAAMGPVDLNAEVGYFGRDEFPWERTDLAAKIKTDLA